MRYLRLLRPHQWIKNTFVFVGLLFGHAWNDAAKVEGAVAAFVAFCLISSAVYVFNDLMDREQDRLHPRKANRPLASGAVGVPAAVFIMAFCAVAGLGIAFFMAGWPLIYLAYIVLNVAYSLGLKHVVILDVFIIASGFMLRLLAGTSSIGIVPSQWLLLCGLLLTLFLGFAKRRAELIALEEASANHRAVLEHYSPALLDQMITVVASGVLVTYSLYTMSPATVALHGTDRLIYTVPFVLYGMFRYLFLLHRRGGGGDAAQDLVRDSHLILAVAGWLMATVSLLLLRAPG
ncbi:MAG: decaprenyl-phosphate phosphoribosyltransferase, partial [Rhodocyclaceae bacterium]